ncbi:heat shock transcription factor, X-linked member 3-like [Cebus imitator]|uniref:heat shock transcription factor, X-linked member 3-like n=1 Tax=Cebus imitator TaxID=2715852 RepID=UPI0018997472|nr:heat shock transcription factor, X-linked member 3-like [Cebus imitator]
MESWNKNLSPWRVKNTEQEYEAKLAPSVGGEPTSGGPASSSPDLNLDSGDILDRHEDQAVSQDSGSQDNPPREEENQRMASMEDNHKLPGFSFPRKMWMMVEKDIFRSVRWNDDGDAVIIEKDLFQRQTLQRSGAEKIFETDSWKSFIRQLNPYGFCKICPITSPGDKNMMIYHSSNFQRGKLWLLENIRRKGDLRNTTQQVTHVPAPKRAKLVHHSDARNAAIEMSQGGTHNVQGPSGTQSFTHCSMQHRNTVTGHPPGYGPPQEPNNSNWEGTSGNVTFGSLATAWVESTREVPSSLVYPDNSSIMSLDNEWYSILLASLLVYILIIKAFIIVILMKASWS